MNPSNKQLAIYNEWKTTDNNILIQAVAGCLALDTKVLMYDGHIEDVQNIKVGDILMGDDSTPRKVLSLCRGKEQMYQITPVKGDSFICNESHILTLYDGRKKQLIDISVRDFINISRKRDNYLNDCKGFYLQRTLVDFKEQDVYDPYLCGLWLGDGSKTNGNPVFYINTKDTEIINYLKKVSKERNLDWKQKKDNGNSYIISLTNNNSTSRDIKLSPSSLRNIFKEFGDSNTLHIPKKYLINSKKNRLNLLAGILDTDGYYCNKRNIYEITVKQYQFAKDIEFLCRSLGFSAYLIEKKSKIKSLNFEGIYYRMCISGNLDEIPVRLLRRKAKPRGQIKNVLRTGFSIKKLTSDNYYGFTLDGNNRFLLGDFTITHNSGKTTTLIELMRFCEYKTLYIAFNTSIKKETEEKVERAGFRHVKALTMHSIGRKAIEQIFSNKNMVVDDSKNWKIITELEKRIPIYFMMKSGLYSTYEEIIRLKITLNEMNNISRDYLENDPDTIIEIMKTMDKTPYINEGVNLGELWKEYINIREEFYNRVPLMIDFKDMIFLPARGDYYIPFDPYYLMLDEAQDFNIAQHKLINNLISQGNIHKWIAVGDRRQSIYGFAGAYASSFDLFKTKDKVVEMPLDICYRCPTSVIDYANEVYNVLIPFKGDKGIVDTCDKNDISILKSKQSALVICRNTKPLIQLFFKLVKENKPCKLLGKDIKNQIINFLSSYKKFSIGTADSEIIKEMLRISSKKNISELEKMKLAILKDNYDMFKLLVVNMGFLSSQSVIDLLEKFKKLFKEGKEEEKYSEEDGIVLCTIHKAKGLESDVVFILNENLIPSRFAKSEQQITQEYNLKYVARTRAKKEMYFLNIEDEKSNQNEL